MTRFTLTSDPTWGDGSKPRSVTLMSETMDGWNAYAGKAFEAVKQAEELLTVTIAHLNSGPGVGTAQIANHFFLTSEPMDGAEVATIQAILIKTLNGMTAGGLGIKFGAAEKGIHGKVIGKRRGNAPTASTKKYHNVVEFLNDKLEWRQGAIHIEASAFGDPMQTCKTLIHEATHKYAGTEDYCYFLKGDKPATEFTSKERALRNADGYAYFTLLVGGMLASGNGAMLNERVPL